LTAGSELDGIVTCGVCGALDLDWLGWLREV
jgi:hypothetical protein